MITRVRIRNFRSIADETVELGPLTVLVGRNGSGKSAFIDALRFLRDALRIGLPNAVSARNGFSALRYHWADSTEPTEIEIKAQYDYSVNATYGVSLLPRDGGFIVDHEKLKFVLRDGKEVIAFETKNGVLLHAETEDGSTFPGIGKPVKWEVNSLGLLLLSIDDVYLLSFALDGNYYTLYPEILRRPQAEQDAFDFADDGHNIGAVLRELVRDDHDATTLKAQLQQIVPDIQDISVGELSGILVIQLLHRHPTTSVMSPHEKSGWLGLHQESDGTVRAIGILTALITGEVSRGIPTAPLSLEEPETSLHPGALGVIADAIRETAGWRQVIITTQSPDLIARFRAEELRVVERVDGATRIGSLAEHQRKAIEQELFTTGDLLRIEGLQREPVRLAASNGIGTGH